MGFLISNEDCFMSEREEPKNDNKVIGSSEFSSSSRTKKKLPYSTYFEQRVGKKNKVTFDYILPIVPLQHTSHAT